MPSIYLYLVLYIALLLIISYIIARKQTKEDFLISGRNRGGWQILASKFAAAIGAAYFITYTGFAYEYGLGVFTLLIGMVFGYFLFAYWATPQIHAPSKEHKFYRMGDFVYHKTKSKITAYLTDIISSIILFAWLLVGIIGGAKIIQDFGFLSYEVAVILTAFVVLAYILIAGFKAVIITDIIQSIIIVVLLVLVTYGIIGSESISTIFAVETGKVNIGVALGFFLFGLLATFSYANIYQLCYAAKTKRKLKHGIGLAVIPILIVAFMLLIIGLFMASKVPGLDSGLVFTEALKNFLPASLLPLSIVLFFAGVMSSADTNVYAISSHYALSRKGEPVKEVRKATIILMIITTILALLYADIVNVSIIAGIISLTLSIPMVYLFFKGKNSKRFIGSVVGGVIGVIAGIIFLGIEPSAALTVLVGGVLGLLWNF